MSKQIQVAVKSVLAGVALTITTGAAYAGTVDSALRPFDGGGSSIGTAGNSLMATGQTTSVHSYTDNADLNYSAWGHAGRWYNFEVAGAGDLDTKIKVLADNTADWAPAFTVYSTGSSAWDGGTATFNEFGITGNTPHNFNGTGNIGDNGTLWMTGANGNAEATLAYANSGITHHANETNWGEHIHNGVHEKNGLLSYSDGLSGSVGDGMAMITLEGLDTGWYSVYVGGADASLTGSPFSVEVSAVPVPGAVYLFGSGLIGLLAARRKAKAAA